MVAEELIKFISAYLMSMLKFIAGPAMGAAFGFSFLQTYSATVLGMMTTAVLVTYFGKPIRAFYNNLFAKKRKKFTKSNRRFVYLWRNYGVMGVAMLTPVIFLPVVGMLLMTLWEKRKAKALGWMLFSALFWGVAYIKFLFLLKKQVLDLYVGWF